MFPVSDLLYYSWKVIKPRCNAGARSIQPNSDRSDLEKWFASKDGPVFSKLFRLDRTDPLNFGPKFPEILVEWIAPPVNIRG